ncbi:pyridoxamine 5'-phosphate oxidase [Trichophyton rubrum D6]|nr:pyridoxamine 5'-phosphate oxidase [Trichophyton rubrum MR850]EZF42659.1 pyridoxamine 5'-phosphate oxidase [Trichophyton rubrum CBS 100081]EZF53336.1 pyridoxamine 5'-phosphate oxidase [Trichophyton rubrum CBS 288.86]EZF63948.1 pyridoxamine 5'-phosphate oxidase [Trichophyton rubrum CBS 289.86]EZF74528.1 pyridoxamine 5'-phosphate oxidase [Trichophyton soudanense CBS 452.61]EZF85221.1 pyridoxamine 5'-phosphate oxidase [Trichophyton rubrum MR1448]EZF95981.1 pyridoxamine 5'-phosphate oxidase [Tr
MRSVVPRGSSIFQRFYNSKQPICYPLLPGGRTMTQNQAGEGEPASAAQYHRHPKRLIFAPGDIAAPLSEGAGPTQKIAAMPEDLAATPLPKHLLTVDEPITSGTSTPIANAAVVSNPSRAHQFGTNPPLLYSHLHLNPLHQFHTWFKDARLPASSAPETCTLATVSMPAGRPSARIVYLKELDERGWVVYSNWGSRAGKGRQVFGNDRDGDDEAISLFDGSDPQLKEGNKWAALTFHWQSVERQVRIEGLIEPLSKEESETYWRVRERGSQIGAWASQQSKRLWSNDQPGAEEGDDGRSVLENRVKEMEARFADVKEIPLPPFWGGVRLVPESVEFWQGRKSRLHDRFRYVRKHSTDEMDGNEKTFKWKVERLSP